VASVVKRIINQSNSKQDDWEKMVTGRGHGSPGMQPISVYGIPAGGWSAIRGTNATGQRNQYPEFDCDHQ